MTASLQGPEPRAMLTCHVPARAGDMHTLVRHGAEARRAHESTVRLLGARVAGCGVGTRRLALGRNARERERDELLGANEFPRDGVPGRGIGLQ